MLPPIENVSRRELLIGASAVGVATASGIAEAAAPPAVRTRPDIASTEGQKMVGLYAAAVAAMQDTALLYPPQPTSWTFQAYIHGVPINPFDPANSNGLLNGSPELKRRIDQIYGQPPAGSPQAHWKKAALACWGTCTHASPYFTAWHRWYMYYFERVCRKMCGDTSFMLPYWNYASDIGDSLKLPAGFQNASAPSSLVFDDRGPGFANPQGTGLQNVAMNAGGYLPYPQTEYFDALNAMSLFPSDGANFFQPPQPDYFKFGFSGRLECVPHDLVHGNVGGWMGNVPSAAGDPIFYMHHCQVDRLFASWQALPGRVYNWGTAPDQPSKKDWEDHPASFVDENGAVVTVKLGNALSIATLGYAYDKLAAPGPVVAIAEARTPSAAVAASASPGVPVAAMSAGRLRVGGTGGSTQLRAVPGARTESMAAAPKPGGETTLVLKDLKLVRRPRAPLSVFLNLPPGTTPDLSGPYYVGTISLFNVAVGDDPHAGMSGMAMAQGPLDLRFGVGPILARQRAQHLWDGGAISVTVATVGVAGAADETYLTFGGVALEP